MLDGVDRCCLGYWGKGYVWDGGEVKGDNGRPLCSSLTMCWVKDV